MRNYLKIDGRFLVPGFSIYVLEIKIASENETYFYVGMTGDNHYPSARSVLHRLAGHIDKNASSTQKQLSESLKNIFEKKKDEKLTDDELRSLSIKMHHYPIEGFKESGLKTMNNESLKTYKETKAYKENYKPVQKEVSRLEEVLIYRFREVKGEKHCLNKTNNNKIKYDGKYNEVYDLIKNEFELKN
jgi:hypothetical protein